MKQLIFPELRQTYGYDCGAKALQSVLVYYGIELSEEVVMKSAKTTKRSGTKIKDMLHVLTENGLKYDSKEMSIADLKKYIDRKIPVMILLQAWHKTDMDYTNKYRIGHWVVAIGYDGEKFLFEDPNAFYRTFLTEKELIGRWRSVEDGNKVMNHGIAVYGKKPSYEHNKIIHMD